MSELVDRFEAAKARLDTLLSRKMKFEASLEMAELKKSELNEKVVELGIDPEDLEGWIAGEGRKLEKAVKAADKEMDAAEEQFQVIEERLRG